MGSFPEGMYQLFASMREAERLGRRQPGGWKVIEALQAFAIEHIVGIKAMHIVVATMWAFYFISGMFLLMPAITHIRSLDGPDDTEETRRAYWVIERYERSGIVEHICFPIILCAGGLMWLAGAANLSFAWFAAKMVIVLGMFLPGTLSGMYYAYVKGPRLRRRRDSDPLAYFEYLKLFANMIVWTSLPFVVMLASVLFLALMKPF